MREFIRWRFLGSAGHFELSISRQRGVTTQVEVNHKYFVIDNAWIWRADHTAVGNSKQGGPAAHGRNAAMSGLVINADYVTTYGLMVEHQLQVHCTEHDSV